jgi:hypothetical protein
MDQNLQPQTPPVLGAMLCFTHRQITILREACDADKRELQNEDRLRELLVIEQTLEVALKALNGLKAQKAKS